MEDLKTIRKDMVSELTRGLGVGAGELAADDDLVHSCPIEVAAGLVELAEEVADVVLGTRVQDPEVGGSSMAAYLQRRADGQKQIRDAALIEKKTMAYPRRGRSGGGASEEPSLMRLLLAICLEEGEEARVFGAGRRRRQRKLWPMKRIQCRWGDL